MTHLGIQIILILSWYIAMFSQELIDKLKARWLKVYNEHLSDEEANDVMHRMTSMMQLVIKHELRRMKSSDTHKVDPLSDIKYE